MKREKIPLEVSLQIFNHRERFDNSMKMRGRKGFTIVELMISISILLILFAMLAVIFKATQESFSKANALQDVINTSRIIIERMHNEISAAFFDPQGRASLIGADEVTGRLKAGSIADELFFCMPLTESEDSDIAEIGYWLRSDGNLIRHYEADANFDFLSADADDELGLIVRDLQFTFFDGTAYIDTWDSRLGAAQEGKSPKTVKAVFTVSDDDNLIVKDFETVVFISSGKRY